MLIDLVLKDAFVKLKKFVFLKYVHSWVKYSGMLRSRDTGYVNRNRSEQCVLKTYSHASCRLCQKYTPGLM